MSLPLLLLYVRGTTVCIEVTGPFSGQPSLTSCPNPGKGGVSEAGDPTVLCCAVLGAWGVR